VSHGNVSHNRSASLNRDGTSRVGTKCPETNRVPDRLI
jgi:hypothetical protein